ncbi:hypothetical protein Y032_0007g3547 [Ancylostoma ceylanicum]|nr:hypothetical protein Y032_0007g3547 [Ancylostoma ceylanicum]
MLDYYAKCGFNYQILLYPEGTDKCPLATERSRKFAEENELVHYEYVLHPRTTGFVHMIQNMRKAKYIDHIYDVTIGFGDCIVQSEVDFAVHGVCPKDVHYQVRKLNIADLPKGDKELGEWLVELWKEKEEKLRRFYMLDRKNRMFENTPNGREYEMSNSVFAGQLLINFFWVITTIMWAYGFFMSIDQSGGGETKITKHAQLHLLSVYFLSGKCFEMSDSDEKNKRGDDPFLCRCAPLASLHEHITNHSRSHPITTQMLRLLKLSANHSTAAPPPFSANHNADATPPLILFANHNADATSPSILSAKHNTAVTPPFSANHNADATSPLILSAKHNTAASPPLVLYANDNADAAPPLILSANHNADATSPPILSANQNADATPP